MSDSLESRVAELEADLTTLSEHGTLDVTDRDDALGRLDQELRGLDAEEQFDVAFGAAFAGAFLFPPPMPDFPACLWRSQPIHELAAHAAAFVPGGGE